MDRGENAIQEMEVLAVSKSPRTHVDSQPLPTDSMVTVSLSERSRPSSLEIMHGLELYNDHATGVHSVEDTVSIDTGDQGVTSLTISQRVWSQSSSGGSDTSEQLNWAELDRTEEQEHRDEGSDVQIAMLLARLEQENNALATDPKSGLKARARSHSRPPSVQQLRKLVLDQNILSVRFSLLPSPPPMTELDFWAALVRDYPQTAQRLPTLTSNKVRGGIPAPLRGVVWVSMAGARERLIEEQYDTLCGESSPYENMINKDIGRSFPGVEMFRDPEGEGQRMLGRVLKCFSLYDTKIGYCQGLGFLVGPLLMQMEEREAFCVLVRLMEDYDLRSCFLPDLSGLHLRIYQFQRLLHQHMPQLAAHLDSLGVEAAYLSQWFLSFFAVTCPLPMLFRIYDVIFAEGASETTMRVALSIMQRNEKKILAFTEFEDVMQLLLSRALWDPYGCNAKSADSLVNDFVSFTGLVTRESLQALEASFKDAQSDGSASKPSVLPSVQTAASRFLGRLWAPSINTTKSSSLSPGPTTPSRPLNFMARTLSKQSLVSTLNSVEENSDSSTSHASTSMTESTDVSTESSADCMSIKSAKSRTESVAVSIRAPVSSKDKDLHSQIEDLLTALSEMQREHSLLSAQLQREREERNEDHRVVHSLVDRLKQDHYSPTTKEMRRRTAPNVDFIAPLTRGPAILSIPEDICKLADDIEFRFSAARTNRRSSTHETRAQLRETIARTREQLNIETIRSRDLACQLATQEQESANVRDHLKEARLRIQDGYNERQRLEKMIQDLRNANSNTYKPSLLWSEAPLTIDTSLSRFDASESSNSSSNATTGTSSTSNGLREFRLGSTSSTRSQKLQSSTSHATKHNSQTFSKRTSSLSAMAVLATVDHAPVSDDALLLELVNAKTAEAVARQELEEMKSKFESLRKMLGVSTPSPEHRTSPSEGGYMSLTMTKGSDGLKTPSNGGGGFWGWGKRSVSSNAAVAAAGDMKGR